MEVKFDELIKDIGSFGRYQKWMFALLSLAILPFTLNTMGIVFIAAVPDYQCAVGSENGRPTNGNDTLVIVSENGAANSSMVEREYVHDAAELVAEECHVAWNESNGGNITTRRKTCNSWYYDTSEYVSTIVSEWDLVCRNKWMAASSGSIYMLGLMAGCLLFGDLSDRLGRMRTFTLATIIQIAVGIGTAFAPNFPVFVALRFVTAMAIMGQYNSAYVLLQELVGVNWRATVGIGIMFYWAVGYVLLGFIALAVRDWRHLTLIMNCPLALLLLFRWLAPESPRWLLLKGKKEEAIAVLQKIARCNHKTSLPEAKDIHISKDQVHSDPKSIMSFVHLQMFRHAHVA